MNNLEWWYKFYTDLEKGLIKYTRPVNWQEKAQQAETRVRKPVRNQYEGIRSKGDSHGD